MSSMLLSHWRLGGGIYHVGLVMPGYKHRFRRHACCASCDDRSKQQCVCCQHSCSLPVVVQLCTRIELLGSSTATALATCHRVQLLLQPCASKQQLECLLHSDTNSARNRSLPGFRRGHETKQQHEQKKREAQDCR